MQKIATDIQAFERLCAEWVSSVDMTATLWVLANGSTVKAAAEKRRFLFMNGISKFLKRHVLSGLNNLVGKTMALDIATLFGYTHNEDSVDSIQDQMLAAPRVDNAERLSHVIEFTERPPRGSDHRADQGEALRRQARRLRQARDPHRAGLPHRKAPHRRKRIRAEMRTFFPERGHR